MSMNWRQYRQILLPVSSDTKNLLLLLLLLLLFLILDCFTLLFVKVLLNKYDIGPMI